MCMVAILFIFFVIISCLYWWLADLYDSYFSSFFVIISCLYWWLADLYESYFISKYETVYLRVCNYNNLF